MTANGFEKGIEVAFEACERLFERAKEQLKTPHVLWTDGESILKKGLIPIGDAIIGYSTFADEVERLQRPDLSDRLSGLEAGYSVLLKTTADAFFTECNLGRSRSFWFHGSPYVVGGHLNDPGKKAQAPEITAGIAYGVLCASSVLKNLNRWGQRGRKSDWVELREKAVERLLDAQRADKGSKRADKGSSWSGFPEGERAELFPTMLACQALQTVGDQDENGREACEAVKLATKNVIETLQRNTLVDGDPIWSEYISVSGTGRVRLLDQIMGLTIIFENSAASSALGDQSLLMASAQVFSALNRVFQRAFSLGNVEADYHLMRDERLIGLVPWEDVSAPYWMLALFLTVDDWIEQLAAQLERVEESATTPKEISFDPLAAHRQMLESARSLSKSAMAVVARKQLLSFLRNEQENGLWPKRGMRVYASWAAATQFVRTQGKGHLFEGGSTSDSIFLALYKTFVSSLFASDFANQVVRDLETNFKDELADPSVRPTSRQPIVHSRTSGAAL